MQYFALAFGLLPAVLAAVPPTYGSSTTLTCAGFLGTPCPTGYTCIDDPSDDCDPENGGADCIGICVTKTASSAPTPTPTGKACGGLAGIQCPDGEQCVDNPTPDCPAGMAADCPGICEPIEGSICGGIAGLPCPDGYYCGNFPKGCNDCFGECLKL